MKKSPLTIAKERFGTEDRKEAKEKLIEAVKSLASGDLWIERVNEDAGFERVSNKKLLHLHEVLTQVKEKYGSRSKMIDAIVKAEGREKDKDYRKRFEKFPTPKLFDYVKSATAA